MFPYNRTYRYDELQEIAQSFCTTNSVLIFSIFTSVGDPEIASVDDGVWKVKAPDIESSESPLPGDITLFTDYWRITDSITSTPQMSNPTWRDIIREVDLIMQRGDGCGVYLEGFELAEIDGKVRKYKIIIGS